MVAGIGRFALSLRRGDGWSNSATFFVATSKVSAIEVCGVDIEIGIGKRGDFVCTRCTRRDDAAVFAVLFTIRYMQAFRLHGRVRMAVSSF